jgi:hypothetical protein
VRLTQTNCKRVVRSEFYLKASSRVSSSKRECHARPIRSMPQLRAPEFCLLDSFLQFQMR